MDIERIPDIANPYDLFTDWYAKAEASDGVKDHTAMTVSTVDTDGQPWSRILLLKGFDEQGFTFFTNSNSIKGQQLDSTGKASLCFYWASIDKQIRIVGTTDRISSEESDAYFASRERESQLGAWASLQSEELDSIDTLIARFMELTMQYDGKDVPRPPHWNGYRLTPSVIEFWSAGPHRLHDRKMYTADGEGHWTKIGLYP